MNKIKIAMISLVAMFGLATIAMPVYVGASPKSQITGGIDAVDTRSSKEKRTGSLQGLIKNIINIMLYLIGAISVVMIIVGGIRYTTSTGDSSRVKASKDTIMYAVVGLVVAIMAYAIVNFVVTSLFK